MQVSPLSMLVALNRLRNKLAHTDWIWANLKKVKLNPCKGGPPKLLIEILGINDQDHFIRSSDGKLRLNHEAGKLILQKVIDAILLLQNIARQIK